MKKLAVAMVITGGLAAWIPAARAQEYSKEKNFREAAEARGRPNPQSEQDTRKTAMADKELSANTHNGKTITANFQALYDSMSEAQKKTAVFRNRISTAEK